MHKVIVINLNGNAYQLDEPAYERLRAYLDRANTELAANPDRAEILADIEQAIADKCNRVLAPHKTVVSDAEIAQILEQMGTVEADGQGTNGERQSGAKGNDFASRTDAPKRLYQIREGSMISGVCTGIGAYFNIDPMIVRIAFVLFTLLTGGIWILVYIVLMFIIPYANTSEERAAARGVQFNAQQLIDQAKKNYATFKETNHWKWQWQQQGAYWQRAWQNKWQQSTGGAHWWGRDVQPTAGYGAQLLAGVLAPVLVILNAALFVLLACALISLLVSGTIMQWSPPSDVPLWAAILILVLVYNVIAWPLHAARRASFHALGYGFGRFAAAEGLIGFGFSVLFFWLAYRYVPEVHRFVHDFPTVWPSLWEHVRQSMR